MHSGLTVAELPLAGFARQMMEGASEQMRQTLAAAERTVRGQTTHELKEGVDAVELLISQAKLLGQNELLLQLDDEALARQSHK